MTTDQRTIGCFFEITLSAGRTMQFRTTHFEAGGQGWHRKEKRTWVCEWTGASPDDVTEAARIAARMMREWNNRAGTDEVRDHWVPGYTKTRFAGRSIVDLPGFGFGRSSSN
ncbi:hypothetical protein ACFQX7_30520 [Luedemannella flava]